MNQNEFDSIINRFFDGAARVRAKKNGKTIESHNIHKKFSSRIISQMWDEEKEDIKAA